MPTLFLSHGAPPLVDDPTWVAQLRELAATLPRPKAILMASAHWESAPLMLGATETVPLQQKVLEKNDLLAEQNRRWLAERGVLALNVTSSPGAGKTTLLERTIRELSADRRVAVIEGDQETLGAIEIDGGGGRPRLALQGR